MSQGEAVVAIDTNLYCLDAVKRLAYWYCDRFSVRLESSLEAPGFVRAVFKGNADADSIPFDADKFFDQLLDFDLRVRIAAETRAIRELIVAKAFAPIESVHEYSDQDFFDPVSAGQSWEELNGAVAPRMTARLTGD